MMNSTSQPVASTAVSTLYRTLRCAALFCVLQACATTTTPVSFFDFGALPKTPEQTLSCALPPIYLTSIASPAALDNNLMLYRLVYANDQQSHAFANHRWSTTPAQLLALRIKSYLAQHHVRLIDSGVANPDGWQLRLDLNDFSQYFSDAGHSYAQLELRATLLRGNSLIAQTTMSQQAPAESADAPAGALAMRLASDRVISDIGAWLCTQPHP